MASFSPAASRVDPRVAVEWRPLAEVDREAWQRLASASLEPNVFYEPAFALAAAPLFGAGVNCLLAWSDDTPRRLVGLWPLRVARRRYGVPLPLLEGWTHPFAPLGAPLIDRHAADAVLAAWFARLSADRSLPAHVLQPFMPNEGPLAAAFDRAVAPHPQERFAIHARAVLRPQPEHAPALALDSRKRKELRRQRRRLEDHGPLQDVAATSPEAVAAALADFLTLEAAGWKGRAGTAAAIDPRVASFMTEAVAALAVRGRVRIDRLLLSGRSIAAAITLFSEQAAWFWKIAYDEDHARASPGVQIALDLSEALLARGDLDRVDSCATAGHPMIDHLWRGRMELADRLVSLRDDGVPFAVLVRLERLRRSAIEAARSLRAALHRS